jgi:hypothetical protein
MNVHVQHPHTAAAAKAHEVQYQMEDHLHVIRDINRTIIQIGTFDDVVPDDRDRLMFLTLTRVVDNALGELERLRLEIGTVCHEARYGEPRKVQS